MTASSLPDLVRRELAAIGDPAKAAGMQTYMKSEMPFRGVGAVPLRQLCRRLFAEHRLPDEASWQAAVLDLWDHVDAIASHLVGDILRSHPDLVTPLMRAWAVEDDLWVRRTAILCQLRSKGTTDVDLLTDVLDANLDGSTRTTPPESPYGREFFVRKAVGWALREHAKTDPRWVLEYVASRGPRLSGLSRREALKHLAAAAT